MQPDIRPALRTPTMRHVSRWRHHPNHLP